METVLVESLFSIMNYNNDKMCSSLNNSTVANIFHIRDIKIIIDKVYDCLSDDDIALNTERACLHKLLL